MSRPTWRVYEVRSNSCSSAPKTISTCSTVLRSPSSRLSTRLRTSRPPSWARAQCSVAPSPIGAWRCWKMTWSGPKSWMLATRSSASRARWISSVPLKSDWPPLPVDRRRTQLLDDRCGRPLAELDDRPSQQRAVRRTGRPADDDRAFEADAGGNADRDALVPAGPCQLGEAVGRPERAGVDEEPPGGVRVRTDQTTERLDPDAGRVRLGIDDERGDAVLAQVGQARQPVRRSAGRICVGSRGRLGVEARVLQRGATQIDVRRVELVRLARQRGEQSEGLPTVGRQPVRLTGRDGFDRCLVEVEGEIGGSAPRGARSRRPLGRAGAPAVSASPGTAHPHPSDPSISSLTRRLNSIAYSIGSSLVKTSRKPWTMRFCASFSVRPRLMR